jgi:CRISPR/Cas system-associated exonuclease Cas4 (RecB family)
MKCEHLSATSLKTFELCPMKYRVTYDFGFESPPGPEAMMGKAVHKVLENTTNNFMAGKESVHDDLIRDACKSEGCPDRRFDVDWFVTTALAWGYLRKADRCVGCELRFEFKCGDTPVVGYIDRLDLFPPEAEIIDIKTQKNAFKDEELATDWQARVYNLAVRSMYPEIIGPIKVSFWVLRHQVQKIIKTANNAKDDMNRLSEIIGKIRDCDEPECRPSALCPWCSYYGQCADAKKSIRSRKLHLKNTAKKNIE